MEVQGKRGKWKRIKLYKKGIKNPNLNVCTVGEKLISRWGWSKCIIYTPAIIQPILGTERLVQLTYCTGIKVDKTFRTFCLEYRASPNLMHIKNFQNMMKIKTFKYPARKLLNWPECSIFVSSNKKATFCYWNVTLKKGL